MSRRNRDHIFISYSHNDEEWLARLQTILRPLTRQRVIDIWADTDISAGDKWREKISEALDSARIAVLLVSPNFLASDFITNHELPQLLRAAAEDGVKIFWIAISASLYKETDLAQFQAANDPAKPLDTMSPADVNRTLVKIAESIKATFVSKLSAEAREIKKHAIPREPNQSAMEVPLTSSLGSRNSMVARNRLPDLEGVSDGEPSRYQSTQFVGRDAELASVLEVFRSTRPPRIVCIDGLGGIGKTALAAEVVRVGLAQGHATRQLWRTAKQEVLLGPHRKHLNRDPISWRTIRSEFLRAREDRRGEDLLFVLDNLETTEGLDELLVEFPDVVGSHVGIVTSRERLHWHPGVRSLSLKGLTEKDSIEFLRTDGETRSVDVIAAASEDDLKKIAAALEGSPLAMKLVVGLSEYLSVEAILDWLLKAKMDQQVQGGSLYTFIYLDAWSRLSDIAREVLIYVGKTSRNTVAQSEITAVFSRLGRRDDGVYSAITELARFCLIDPDSKPGLSDRRYGIHALTRAFVTTELPKLWRNSNP